MSVMVTYFCGGGDDETDHQEMPIQRGILEIHHECKPAEPFPLLLAHPIKPASDRVIADGVLPREPGERSASRF